MRFGKMGLIGIIITFFLTACSNRPYHPDLHLKKAWSPELEEKEQLAALPYALEYSNSNKRLIIALLTNQPDHKVIQDKMLQEIDKVNPDVVLSQPEVQPDVLSLVKHLEPYGYTAKDFAYFQMLHNLNQFYGPRLYSQKGLERRTARLIKELNLDPCFKKWGPFSIAEFKKWFSAKTDQNFTLLNVQADLLTAPISGGTYLQTFSFREDELQDQYFLERLAEVLNDKQNKTVVVLRAGSKFVTEGAILTKMMGSKPKIFFK